jgi:hypothetical protein
MNNDSIHCKECKRDREFLITKHSFTELASGTYSTAPFIFEVVMMLTISSMFN